MKVSGIYRGTISVSKTMQYIAANANLRKLLEVPEPVMPTNELLERKYSMFVISCEERRGVEFWIYSCKKIAAGFPTE